ncbi:hypothetical protein [Candidatus Sneabacter namystus]|uniref:Uncharacterized protein n=1 Tax=Candidatus Sneabacter namystus TaxID=2601646 RepID=A0A5C0UI27_9RICK|nr:hypothetical protein [Candidatus Sneabacter namystus]QEK39400.1 hypothetical protein FZC37_00380 [Candidatus Sneabacter namystus]
MKKSFISDSLRPKVGDSAKTINHLFRGVVISDILNTKTRHNCVRKIISHSFEVKESERVMQFVDVLKIMFPIVKKNTKKS